MKKHRFIILKSTRVNGAGDWIDTRIRGDFESPLMGANALGIAPNEWEQIGNEWVCFQTDLIGRGATNDLVETRYVIVPFVENKLDDYPI